MEELMEPIIQIKNVTKTFIGKDNQVEEEDAAVVFENICLLSASARWFGDYPVERQDQGNTEELDWPF